MPFLGDLAGMTRDEVVQHIRDNYTTNDDFKDVSFLIAYESVGSYGCDSSSFFLFQDNTTGQMYEVHGSHCSCYGFEDQWRPEETSLVALTHRATNGSVFGCGGYDDNSTANEAAVAEYILRTYAAELAEKHLLKGDER